MNWIRIIRPESEDWFSDKLKKQAETLGAEVDAIEAERGRLDKTIAEAKAEDVAEADLGNLVLFPGHLDVRLGILQKEILLRRKLPAYYDAMRSELLAEVERAWHAAEKAERDLRKKLVQLGYHDVPNGTLDVAKIQPIFIQSNPAVQAARKRHRSLQSRAGDPVWARENQAALEQVIHELEEARQRALPT